MGYARFEMPVRHPSGDEWTFYVSLVRIQGPDVGKDKIRKPPAGTHVAFIAVRLGQITEGVNGDRREKSKALSPLVFRRRRQ